MLYQIKDRATGALIHETSSYLKAIRIGAKYDAASIIILVVSGSSILGKVA
jgi:hypothetical protein